MPAKFEDLPVEAHSLIRRHLNRDDCCEMRKASAIWTYVLIYEVKIDESTVSKILEDIKIGRSLLDFTHVKLQMCEIDEKESQSNINEIYYELLRIIGDKIIHLVGEHQNILYNKEILPNLQTIHVTDAIFDQKIGRISYQLERFSLSHEITIIKNFEEFSTLLMEKGRRYLKEVWLMQYSENISIERWQRAIIAWDQLEILDLGYISNLNFLQMCAFHLPATTPLKKLKISCHDNFSNILDIFFSKWAHSLESVDLRLLSYYDLTSVAPLKHLQALHTLKIYCYLFFHRFELYYAIAKEVNDDFQELSIIGGKIDEEEMILILQNLPRLRKLKLSGSSGTVTDRTLATIFSNLTRLEELVLDCDQCTDVGFLGFGDIPSSISRLRYLTCLKIDTYENNMERVFTEIVQMKELRKIELPDISFYPKLLKMLKDDCCIHLRRNIEKRLHYRSN